MKYLMTLLCVLCLATATHAGVLVNEVLVNEPSGQETLEWIELYNDSADYVDLDQYLLNVNGTSISLYDIINGSLPPRSYLIICRNLIASGGSPGFESVWGDSSGLWGDTPEEAALRIAEESFTLPNQTGYIQLYSFSTLVSQLDWTGVGADGYSWERVSASNNTAVFAADPTGSTPGRANSVSPVALDLAIDLIRRTSLFGGSEFNVEITNPGTDTAKTQSILLYRRQPSDSTDTHDTILTQSIDPLAPGKRDTLSFALEEPGVYVRIGLLLSNDDKSSNNRGFLTATGLQYPPIILSEILPDPVAPLSSEWIELHNISDSTFNLAGWQIGDRFNIRVITNLSTDLPPGGRAIIVQDSAAFRLFYPDYDGIPLHPSSWPSLNNDGDLVRLIDSVGLQADRNEYESGFGENFSIARNESEQNDGPWLKSAEAGGTPGEINQVWTQPTGAHTSIAIEPKVFSPDGDGFEDQTTLSLTVVDASAYTLKIFDRTGNVVKTFLDSGPLTTGTIYWDGKSDAGNRLPIGIYICYLESEGVESIKETVVIAR
jgi:hypothetical protein